MATSVSSVGLIGAGKMASALARGFLAAEGLITADRITASAPRTDKIRVSCEKRGREKEGENDEMHFLQKLGINIASSNLETVKNSEVVWIAVKPHLVAKILKEISPAVTPDHLIMSVAAGVTLNTMEKVRDHVPHNLHNNLQVLITFSCGM